jgi:LPS-assembly lipoprotein
MRPASPFRAPTGGTVALAPDKGASPFAVAVSRRAILLAPLALAACGFAPAYAPGGPATALLGTVRAQDPTDKNGFDLVERLEERLGRPEAHRYDLAYTITTEAVGVGITTENEITRYNLKGVIEYTLSDRATGARLAGGRVQSFTAYSATGSTVAGLAAEEDAAYRLMRILADQITARLIAISPTLP